MRQFLSATGSRPLHRLSLRGLFLALVVGLLLTGQASLSVAAPGEAPAAGRSAETTIAPVRSCGDLIDLDLPNTTVESATAVAPSSTIDADYCDVQLLVTEASTGVTMRVGVFLPISTWNGRLLGVGGGGYAPGDGTQPCGNVTALTYDCGVEYGFVTTSTDGGMPEGGGTGTFALTSDNALNWPLIRSVGYAGIHQMTVTAKSVINAYYGTGPKFSYFWGGSGGGRNAMMEAQRYPADYDGIHAFQPAINWTKFIPAELWPQLVMNWAETFIPQSTFQAVNEEVVAACDGLDGVEDSIIANWQDCDFDASSLIGDVVTAQEAEIINKIWEGPRGPTASSSGTA